MRARRALFVATIATTMVLGVISATPSIAGPEKIFSLQAPSSIQAGATGAAVPITITNETPSGNSSINSLTLSVTGGLTITHVSVPSGAASWTAGTVSVSNMSPVKNGQSFVLTLTVDVAAGSSCAAGSVTWDAVAWTGSSFSGDQFRLLRTEIDPKTHLPYSQLVTQITAGCQLVFVSGRAPTDGIIDTPITGADGSAVQVELLSNGAPASWFNGTVTIDATSSPSGAALSGASESATGGIATFSALSADTPGDYVVHASALGQTSDPVSFSLFFSGIFCGDTVGGTQDGTSFSMTRTDAGAASGCEEIPYTLTVSRDLITLVKDQSLVRSQGATFEVTITWAQAAGDYPDFGVTQIDIDGPGPIPPFVPDSCVVVDGVAQYPDNPNANGYYPAPGTVQPWCVSNVVVQPEPGGDIMQVTETYLGSGDPNWSRS
jgi:hypothetical protein